MKMSCDFLESNMPETIMISKNIVIKDKVTETNEFVLSSTFVMDISETLIYPLQMLDSTSSIGISDSEIHIDFMIVHGTNCLLLFNIITYFHVLTLRLYLPKLTNSAYRM